jgi:PII-like signaling protein
MIRETQQFKTPRETRMNGFQLTFFTQQDRRHQHQPLSEWLILAARDLGIRGATLVAGSEGFGQHRRIHSARFFELADQPQEIVMAVSEEESARLFDLLQREGVHLFYVKAPVEFGVLGQPER